MSDDAQRHYGIDYVEIPTQALAASKAFWARAFGWAVQDYGPSYAGLSRGGREHGGLREVDHVAAGGPLVILYANDLERALSDVGAAGGEVTRPIFSFPGGRRFHFREPGGCELAVWSENA